MNNLRRKALELSSMFGLLTSQRTLVLAIGEERQVHETILKNVLARVNACTSLLRWGKMEQNERLKATICQLYDVNLMYASVQREFAEQSNRVIAALKDIHACEVALDQIQKKLLDVKTKRERLQKAEGDTTRKTSRANCVDDIAKLKEDELRLSKELETKRWQAERFKCTSLKTSLSAVCAAHLTFATKISLIFEAAQKIVNEINDIPQPPSPQEQQKQQQSREDSGQILIELAEALNINRPISSQIPPNSSKFHVDLDNSNKDEIKKKISNPVLLTPPSRPLRSIKREENVDDGGSSEVHADGTPIYHAAPADAVSLPHGHRRRSNTSDDSGNWREKKSISTELATIYSVSENKYDEVEYNNGAIVPRPRSNSDSRVSTSKSNDDYGYCDPWENFHEDQEEAMKALNNEIGKKLKSDDSMDETPITIESVYDVPEMIMNQGSNESTVQYPQHYNVVNYPPRENVGYGNPNRDSDAAERIGAAGVPTFTDGDQLENVEYIDNNLIQQAIKSKFEQVENIPLTRDSPSPRVRPKPGNQNKLSSQSVRMPESYRKVPPKPKPRPSTQIYENPVGLSHSQQSEDDNSFRGGTVREMAAQMSVKIQPASLVPTMTQAKLAEQEKSAYQNLK